MTLPFSLRAAASRTYSVPVPAAGTVCAPLLLAPKSSADVLDYTLNFSIFLSGTNDTLTAVEVSSDSNQSGACSVTAVRTEINGATVTLLLASGQPYSVTVTNVKVTTAQGRVFVVSLQVQITGVTPATLPLLPSSTDFPADVTANGGVLTAGTAALPPGFESNGGAIVRVDPFISIPTGYAANGGLIVSAP